MPAAMLLLISFIGEDACWLPQNLTSQKMGGLEERGLAHASGKPAQHPSNFSENGERHEKSRDPC